MTQLSSLLSSLRNKINANLNSNSILALLINNNNINSLNGLDANTLNAILSSGVNANQIAALIGSSFNSQQISALLLNNNGNINNLGGQEIQPKPTWRIFSRLRAITQLLRIL
jgi:hypothetical protein